MASEHDPAGAPTSLAAFSGLRLGPVSLGFLDTMTVTRWDPPRACEVLHTGRLVRGDGWFTVTDLGGGRSRFTWGEQLQLPWGVLGRLGWPLVRPGFVWGVQLSLRRFARWASRYERPGPSGMMDGHSSTAV